MRIQQTHGGLRLLGFNDMETESIERERGGEREMLEYRCAECKRQSSFTVLKHACMCVHNRAGKARVTR